MWSWITDNASGLSAVASFLTLIIWLFYAQLLYYGFRRQRRARVLINQGYGSDTSSICLVTNMSHEPVYIQLLLITLVTDSDRHTCSVTDLDRSYGDHQTGGPDQLTRQGPLNSGQFMQTGSFHDLILQAARENGVISNSSTDIRDLALRSFVMTAISNYGPDGASIGFEREFLVQARDENEAQLNIRPCTVSTRRLKNRRSRQRMQRWLERMN